MDVPDLVDNPHEPEEMLSHLNRHHGHQMTGDVFIDAVNHPERRSGYHEYMHQRGNNSHEHFQYSDGSSGFVGEQGRKRHE